MLDHTENDEASNLGTEQVGNVVAELEAEFNAGQEAGLELVPAEEDLVSLREFLVFLDADAVLEWNSRAQMAEGHFTVNAEKYRVVTTAESVYVGDFETNLGRAFPRHVVDGSSYVYPPPILRFIGLPETLFEPETAIIEGTSGNRFIIIEVPVATTEEVLTEEVVLGYVDTPEQITSISEEQLIYTIETPVQMPVADNGNGVLVMVNIFIVIALILVVLFYKKGKSEPTRGRLQRSTVNIRMGGRGQTRQARNF